MHILPAYQAALDYIFSFVDYSKTHTANLAPENFDLRRMEALLARLDDPQRSFPSIHIAGTKGKGSTAALCAAALTAGGYRTGLYTSPHLQDFCERIQIDGSPISQEALVRLVEEIKPHVEAVPQVSTFEITTALAFMHFSRTAVQAAVLEVGLGGRLDATNVITPLVSVITSISLDHVPILGTTIAEIAAEKGGIIKPGVPVVVAPQKPEALDTLEALAAARGAPLLLVGRDCTFEGLSHTLAGQRLAVRAGGRPPVELEIPLLGRPQIENAATAWLALQTTAGRGLPVSEDAVRAGFRQVHWPGRFEILKRAPFLILDAAHNQDSASKLAETVSTYLPDRKLILVFGASGDKNVRGFLEAILPFTDRLIATRSDHPRAMDPKAIETIAGELGTACTPTPDIESGLQLALSEAGQEDVILVTGSVFVAGAAREVWQSNTQLF